MRPGSFLRKLKLIPTKQTNLIKQQGLVLQLNPPDVFCFQRCPTTPLRDHDDHKGNNLAELEFGLDDGSDDDKKHFEEEQEEKLVAVAPHLSETKMEPNRTPQPQVACIKDYYYPSLTDFEEMCPPGGSNSIILYTTSLRGIRKTFQDCNTIRFLLRSFKVKYHERDVSLHLGYREELWKILGGKVIPPKLFIKGRLIGGADEVVGLHEMGWLGKFLEGTPTFSTDCPCIGCNNMRFTICSTCCGSCKVFTTSNIGDSNNNECFLRCPECNENGLVKCQVCC